MSKSPNPAVHEPPGELCPVCRALLTGSKCSSCGATIKEGVVTKGNSQSKLRF